MSTSRFHADILENGEWQTRSLIDQLGNIGAEAGRAIQAKVSGNTERLQGSWHRMDELFIATLSSKQLRNTRRMREVLYAREVTYAFLDGSNEYHESADTLERYWIEWGILANLERRANRQAK